ncbi:MAG: cardiolipin synthase [Spirochaetia bacterium]|jgi:cardiolipin synthase|nr:cardiolipin synthase [Spirochaetia bacterium]
MIDQISIPGILYWVYAVFTIILSVRILLDNNHPEVSFAWLMAIIFLPYIGAVLYLMGGINWKKYKIVKQRPEITFQKELGEILIKQKIFMGELSSRIDNDIAKTMILSLQSSNSIITLTNSSEIFFSGDLFFTSFIKNLENASLSIHIEYYIFRDDKIGSKISDILKRKAHEGLSVKILFDGVGCFNKMSRKFKRDLAKAGIETKFFLDPANVFSGRLLNYCNHRKIAVIDGKIAYTGGMNIGDEYIDGGKKFESWRDTHVKLEGESVHMLQSVFLSDWYNSGGEHLQEDSYFPTVLETENNLPMQIVVSGPDSDWFALEKLFFYMIMNSNRVVYIQTPYFIPSHSMLDALETTALCGVEVNLMITGNPDKKIPFWVAETYFESLIEAGVNIYLYKKGFLHSKMLIVDDTVSTVGSCNMDIRSFHLDYEVNAVYYNKDITVKLIKQFKQDLLFCIKIDKTSRKQLSVFKRLRNSIFRIFSPVL